MRGLNIARVYLFFSFEAGDQHFSCALWRRKRGRAPEFPQRRRKLPEFSPRPQLLPFTCQDFFLTITSPRPRSCHFPHTETQVPRFVYDFAFAVVNPSTPLSTLRCPSDITDLYVILRRLTSLTRIKTLKTIRPTDTVRCPYQRRCRSPPFYSNVGSIELPSAGKFNISHAKQPLPPSLLFSPFPSS